jgi:hypothetical protein
VRRSIAAVACVLGLLGVVPASAGAMAVPRGFVGVSVGTPLFPDPPPGVDVDKQLDLMVASGVETLRIGIDWAGIQPYKNWSKVPQAQRSQFVNVGGVPTNFAPVDQIVAPAAARGLTLLPLILDAPRWDGIHRRGAAVTIPRSPGPYASFVKALVRRYGPRGSFWKDHSPAVPIRLWQIWNEPNITAFWPIQPFEPSYLALLRASRNAIKRADPGAKVVLAGMPNFSWLQLQKIYAYRGARSLFDVVAVHPYTRDPKGVITILKLVRQVMNAAGDGRKPMVADEISWPSSLGKTFHNTGYDFATTEAGQANKLSRMLPMLARDRTRLRLLAFYYYTWATAEQRNGLAFDFSGLLRFDPATDEFVKKPAFSVFSHDALSMEGCRQKGQMATICLH